MKFVATKSKDQKSKIKDHFVNFELSFRKMLLSELLNQIIYGENNDWKRERRTAGYQSNGQTEI